MATYAIGDIQGCFSAFQRLLQAINFNAGVDTLWLVGDLVNRGPQSLETLRWVKQHEDAVIPVLGNHDFHLIATAEGIRKPKDRDTLADILTAPDCNSLLEWLRHQRLLYTQEPYVMVHAGLLPQWSAAKAQSLAEEVEAELRGPHYRKFIAQMYGNDPDHWDDEFSGIARLRVIINAMARLRFCTAEGVMDFACKEGPDNAPPGFMPWFDAPSRESVDSIVVFGHWSALGLYQRENLIALDSGCVWGRQLSAINLENRVVTQVSC